MTADLGAFVFGSCLSLAVAGAVVARGELRAHPTLLLAGLVMGSLLAGTGFVVDTARLSDLWPLPTLTLELLAQGALQALLDTLLPLAGLNLLLGLPFRHRRRADLFAAGAGFGLGYGCLSALAPGFVAGTVWPPATALAALTAPPFRLFLVLIFAGSMLPGLRLGGIVGLRLVGFALALGYNTGLDVTASIGHWLYWLDPFALSLAWLGTSTLFWPAALLLLWLLRQSDPEAGPPPDARLLLRPRLWLGLAVGLLGLCLITWLGIMLNPTASGLLRLALVMLLAPPLMAGIVTLATGLRLRRRVV